MMVDQVKVQLPVEQRLLHLPEENRAWQPDVDHFRRHGESIAQTAERDRALSREQFEASAVRDLTGDPPDMADTKGLGPAQALYARYRAWQKKIEDELRGFETKKAELEAMVAALGPVKAERWVGVRQTAQALLGRGEGGESNAAALAQRVAIAEHRAEAAKIALQELEGEIDRAQLRVKHIGERENEFLFPALVEAADNAGILADYLECIARLSDAARWLFGLVALAPYGSGFSRPSGPISFPAVPSPAGTKSNLTIDHHGARDVWENLANALRGNPRANIAKLINPNSARRRSEGAQ